ncbi:hypothetical protein ACSG94_003527, partial [Edwardsiella ictaluri]
TRSVVKSVGEDLFSLLYHQVKTDFSLCILMSGLLGPDTHFSPPARYRPSVTLPPATPPSWPPSRPLPLPFYLTPEPGFYRQPVTIMQPVCMTGASRRSQTMPGGH